MNAEELSFWKLIYMATVTAAVESDRTKLVNQYAEEVANRAVEDLRKTKSTQEVDTGI